MSDYEDDFDPKSEVMAETFAEPDVLSAAEKEESQSVSIDYLRSLDGRGSGKSEASSRQNYKARPAGPDGRSTNTGPKGVLKDYEAAKLKLRARRLDAKLSTERAIARTAVGDEKFIQPSKPAEPADRDDKDDDDDSDLDFLDEENDAVFEQYKMQRMQQLQQQAEARPFFGKLEELHVDNYIEEVEEAPDTHIVVVHLYQPYDQYVEGCVRLNFALMNLAEQFTHVRFMRGICTDLLPSFDEIGLPTLMIYRGGKKLDILVRVTDELGANFSDRDLVMYLAEHGALSDASVEQFMNGGAKSSSASSSSSSAASSKNSKIKFSRPARDSDED